MAARTNRSSRPTRTFTTYSLVANRTMTRKPATLAIEEDVVTRLAERSRRGAWQPVRLMFLAAANTRLRVISSHGKQGFIPSASGMVQDDFTLVEVIAEPITVAGALLILQLAEVFSISNLYAITLVPPMCKHVSIASTGRHSRHMRGACLRW